MQDENENHTLEKPDQSWYPNNFDWYVKWAATVFILVSMVARFAGVEYRTYDLAFGTFGIALWLWVSIMWKDRSLIILNTVSLVLLASTLLKEI